MFTSRAFKIYAAIMAVLIVARLLVWYGESSLTFTYQNKAGEESVRLVPINASIQDPVLPDSARDPDYQAYELFCPKSSNGPSCGTLFYDPKKDIGWVQKERDGFELDAETPDFIRQKFPGLKGAALRAAEFMPGNFIP